MPDTTPDISTVIPVRNEQQNLPVLVPRLRDTLDGMGSDFELIFVVDENTDRTEDVLRELHAEDPRVKMLKLSRGFGHHTACVAGLEASSGRSVVLMDGDLQDQPEDIARLHERMLEGYDLVYGAKEKKNDSGIRNLFSGTFVKLLNALSDQPVQHNTNLYRIMSRRLVDEVIKHKEHEPSLTGIMSLIGLPTSHVLVTSGTREHGETKFSFARQLRFALAFLTAFSTKPMRLVGYLGIVLAAASTLGGLSALLVGSQLWAAAGLICAVQGIQLFGLGVVGEYVGRIFVESKARPRYVVEERLGLEVS